MSSSTTAVPGPPYISVHISTTDRTLDLSLDIPFTITVRTTLNAIHPITFKTCDTPFFDRPLVEPGLTFKNLCTGKHISRPTMYVEYMFPGNRSLPTENQRERWMTLHPNHPHITEATFRPVLSKSPVYPTPGITAAEMKELQSQQTSVRKWPYVRGMKNGQTYEIGVSDGIKIKEWVAGDLQGTLDAVKVGTVPALSLAEIGIQVMQSATFTVKRPDEDGALSGLV